jgi:hypothetical protein
MLVGRRLKMDAEICWGERDSAESTALRCLVDAEAYLGAAMLHGSVELYPRVLECSEKIIEHLPRCALAHYFAAVVHLKTTGDQHFAKQKYELLQSFKSGEAKILAKKLKEEMEKALVF